MDRKEFVGAFIDQMIDHFRYFVPMSLILCKIDPEITFETASKWIRVRIQGKQTVPAFFAKNWQPANHHMWDGNTEKARIWLRVQYGLDRATATVKKTDPALAEVRQPAKTRKPKSEWRKARIYIHARELDKKHDWKTVK